MLTDIACKKATCPTGRARARFTDSAGLYLEVSQAGSRRWFYKFLHAGKEKRLSLGSYPAVSLKAARQARDDARRVQQAGMDPVQQRQLARVANQADSAVTFKRVATEFHEKQKASWSEKYAARWLATMKRDAFPWLGKLPIKAITAPILLKVLHRVEARGAHETAHSLAQWAGQVFRFGIASDYCERNPAPDLRGALAPLITKNLGAITEEPSRFGELLRAIDGYQGHQATRTALQLAALLFQRPGNIRMMRWADVDLEGKQLWTIPAADMKRTKDGKLNGKAHLVPLAPQAIALLEDLKPATGEGMFVFPSLLSRERPMSDNALNAALRRLGFTNSEATAHGFRATARTMLVERLGVDGEVVEVQLAHGKPGPLGASYDRAEYVAHRRAMMVLWATYLDNLRDGAQVLPFPAKAA